MDDSKAYEYARKRAKSKIDFYNHVMVYVVVNAFLFAINWFTSPEYYWAFWPLAGWGVGLVLHGATVYLRTDDPELLDQLTEHELEREKAREQETGS